MRNTFPHLVAFHSGNYRLIYAIHVPQLFLCEVGRPNVVNIVPTQLVLPLIFSRRCLMFVCSILGVIGVCSKVKMVGVYTRWIIPSWTVMKHMKTFRYWPSVQYPRGSMASNLNAMPSRSDASIAIDVYTSAPNPTFSDYGYSGKESLWKGFRKTLRSKIIRFNVWLHNQFVWLCHALGCSFTARAFLF